MILTTDCELAGSFLVNSARNYGTPKGTVILLKWDVVIVIIFEALLCVLNLSFRLLVNMVLYC